MKLRLLAGAVALAVAGAANAAIDDSATSGSGNGELFFSIWDTTNKTSYSIDLGVKHYDFVTSTPTSLNFAASSTGLNTYLSGADTANLQWNVASMAEFDSGGVNYANGTYGLTTTTNDGLAAVSDPNVNNASSVPKS